MTFYYKICRPKSLVWILYGLLNKNYIQIKNTTLINQIILYSNNSKKIIIKPGEKVKLFTLNNIIWTDGIKKRKINYKECFDKIILGEDELTSESKFIHNFYID